MGLLGRFLGSVGFIRMLRWLSFTGKFTLILCQIQSNLHISLYGLDDHTVLPPTLFAGSLAWSLRPPPLQSTAISLCSVGGGRLQEATLGRQGFCFCCYLCFLVWQRLWGLCDGRNDGSSCSGPVVPVSVSPLGRREFQYVQTTSQ